MSIFRGSAVALVTPFSDTGVDFDALRRLLDFHLENGTDAIVVCGTTGEASTLTEVEKIQIVSFTSKYIAGRVPVIAGTGCNDTDAAVRLSHQAVQNGADALLVVTPYYNKTSEAGLVAHYSAISDAVNKPIIVYNVPSRTGLNVTPECMASLLKVKNVVGIKESSANIDQLMELLRLCPECELYSGNDNIVFPILALGGCGVISTIANVVPKTMHELCRTYFEGDMEAARKLQLDILPLFKAAFIEVNPIPIKTMAELMGLCSSRLRLPLVCATEAHRDYINRVMRDYGLI